MLKFKEGMRIRDWKGNAAFIVCLTIFRKGY